MLVHVQDRLSLDVGAGHLGRQVEAGPTGRVAQDRRQQVRANAHGAANVGVVDVVPVQARHSDQEGRLAARRAAMVQRGHIRVELVDRLEQDPVLGVQFVKSPDVEALGNVVVPQLVPDNCLGQVASPDMVSLGGVAFDGIGTIHPVRLPCHHHVNSAGLRVNVPYPLSAEHFGRHVIGGERLAPYLRGERHTAAGLGALPPGRTILRCSLSHIVYVGLLFGGVILHELLGFRERLVPLFTAEVHVGIHQQLIGHLGLGGGGPLGFGVGGWAEGYESGEHGGHDDSAFHCYAPMAKNADETIWCAEPPHTAPGRTTTCHPVQSGDCPLFYSVINA